MKSDEIDNLAKNEEAKKNNAEQELAKAKQEYTARSQESLAKAVEFEDQAKAKQKERENIEAEFKKNNPGKKYPNDVQSQLDKLQQEENACKELSGKFYEISAASKSGADFLENTKFSNIDDEAVKAAKDKAAAAANTTIGSDINEKAMREQWDKLSDEEKAKYKSATGETANGEWLSKDLYSEGNTLSQEYNDGHDGLTHVNNFKLPEWGYQNFVDEIDNFRKGLTSLTGEPGWFYFKIFFHFDDNYGLLSEVLTNPFLKTSATGNIQSAAAISSGFNSAIGYLIKRGHNTRYRSSNLMARAIALHRFVSMLSKINIDTPWFFDKITGLDKAGVLTNSFTEEKIIEISCLEDAVDMRLTSLFHMYQYACFDEIWQKEIIPENLRKFNMSIMIYHVPITYHNTSLITSGATTYSSEQLKTNIGKELKIGNRMSFKLFTFKGCEFDLQSMFGVIPGSLDNSKPFNLGKNSIRIKYDRCYTHLMNEWEQFMLGPDGIYYDMLNGIGEDCVGEFHDRLKTLMTASEQSNITTTYDKIFENSFYKTVPVGHSLGNIYNMDIAKLKEDIMLSRVRHINLANLFDYNPAYFRALVIQSNISWRQVTDVPFKNEKTKELIWVKAQGKGGSIISKNTHGQRRKYHHIYNKVSYGNEYGPTETYTDIFQFIENGRLQEQTQIGTLYAIPDFKTTLKNIADSYVNAWKNITGQWKSMVDNLKNTAESLKPKNLVKSLKFW